MAHSDCGWTCGCPGRTVKSLENACHTWALLRWWFTTKRRYIKCMHLYLLPLHCWPIWPYIVVYICRYITCQQTWGVLYTRPVCISVTTAVFPSMSRAITGTPSFIACTVSNHAALARIIQFKLGKTTLKLTTITRNTVWQISPTISCHLVGYWHQRESAVAAGGKKKAQRFSAGWLPEGHRAFKTLHQNPVLNYQGGTG